MAEINIEDYQPVSKTDTCKKCNSTTVAWKKSRTTGKFYLVEVFSISGEEIASRRDFHSVYCGKPDVKLSRVAEILGAATGDDEPKKDEQEQEEQEPPKDEITHDGFPFCCSICGQGVVRDSDHVTHDVIVKTPEGTIAEILGTHTCLPRSERGGLADARARGTRVATRVDFVDISERMESVHRMMQDAHEEQDAEKGAELGSEYLMLRKRLYTEIPNLRRRRRR